MHVNYLHTFIRDTVGDDETGINEHECMFQVLVCVIACIMHHEGTSANEKMKYIIFFNSCDLFKKIAGVCKIRWSKMANNFHFFLLFAIVHLVVFYLVHYYLLYDYIQIGIAL